MKYNLFYFRLTHPSLVDCRHQTRSQKFRACSQSVILTWHDWEPSSEVLNHIWFCLTHVLVETGDVQNNLQLARLNKYCLLCTAPFQSYTQTIFFRLLRKYVHFWVKCWKLCSPATCKKKVLPKVCIYCYCMIHFYQYGLTFLGCLIKNVALKPVA